MRGVQGAGELLDQDDRVESPAELARLTPEEEQWYDDRVLIDPELAGAPGADSASACNGRSVAKS